MGGGGQGTSADDAQSGLLEKTMRGEDVCINAKEGGDIMQGASWGGCLMRRQCTGVCENSMRSKSQAQGRRQ